MDANRTLALIKWYLDIWADSGAEGMSTEDLDYVLSRIHDLDNHLRTGGALPDAWSPKN